MPKEITQDEAKAVVIDSAKKSTRTIIGIVGKPGAGKSTLTSFLLENLVAEKAVLVPMDGYHLSNKLLA